MTFEILTRVLEKVCGDCGKDFETIYKVQLRCDECKASHVYPCHKKKEKPGKKTKRTRTSIKTMAKSNEWLSRAL